MSTPLPNEAHDRARARSRMALANVVRGRLSKPIRICVYGVDGIGKSTFAAGAPAPVFIGAEDGTSTIDVARFPEPKTWRELLAALDELEYGEHSYQTVVLDTLDWIEPLCWVQVVGVGKHTRNGALIESIEDFDYGKGFSAALDEWRVALSRLDRLREVKGMHVVLLAHSWIKTFKNPDGEDFDRHEMKLHKSAASLVREWCDVVLFATHEQYTHKNDKRARAKGISTGARVLHTQRTAAFDAKNRHNLPDTLPLEYEAFDEAVIAGMPAPPEVLRARIAELLKTADDALRARVQAALDKSPDAATLARIANRLSAEITIKQPEAT